MAALPTLVEPALSLRYSEDFSTPSEQKLVLVPVVVHLSVAVAAAAHAAAAHAVLSAAVVPEPQSPQLTAPTPPPRPLPLCLPLWLRVLGLPQLTAPVPPALLPLGLKLWPCELSVGAQSFFDSSPARPTSMYGSTNTPGGRLWLGVKHNWTCVVGNSDGTPLEETNALARGFVQYFSMAVRNKRGTPWLNTFGQCAKSGSPTFESLYRVRFASKPCKRDGKMLMRRQRASFNQRVSFMRSRTL
mmetsp:Transcript_19281/g.48814  ORF Transcript_19281/g.48814 Transcript_19281/m.48814 type:complete len:244 (-) Transcript_19281:137-868(-)